MEHDQMGILPPETYSKRLFYICSGEGILNHSTEPDREALIRQEQRSLFACGADPNFKHKGSYPLCAASRKGYEGVVRDLIGRGANVDVCDKWECSPLYLAASHGHKNICEMLINSHADLNRKNQYGYTPLWTSIENNHVEIAKLLCRSGADVNVNRPNSHGLEMKMLTYVLLAKGDASLAQAILAANCVPYTISNPISYMILEQDDETRRVVQKLICAGFEFEYHHWVATAKHKMATRADEVTEGEKSFVQFIEIETRCPKPLQNLIRLVIRKKLQISNPDLSVKETVEHLELPPSLKKFICMPDVINAE